MNGLSGAFNSSIGRKLVMGTTGLFLISFLVVHAGINALIYANDGGLTFNIAAKFMATNWIIKAMEVVLFLGFIVHIVQSALLTRKNGQSRPVKYAVNGASTNSTWYSRSMGLLGTIILIFLIVHLGNFWIKSRFTGLPGEDSNNNPDLFKQMTLTFTNFWIVLLYVLAMISLGYHLLHGFSSAFQTLGLNHRKYTPAIKIAGIIFSIFIPLLFASMPLAFYLKLIN